MSAMRVWLVVAVGVSVAVAAEARAGERDADEAAIRARTEELAKAFGAGDAAALAAFWTEDGEFVSDEATVHGREKLETLYEAHFEKSPETNVEIESGSVRFLGRDTAIEKGRFHVTRADQPDESAAFSVLYVREEGVWKVAMLRESHDHPSLRDLGWLVGTWEAKTEHATVRTTYSWAHGGSFLKMEYEVTAEGEETAGSQMIGFDTAVGAPRSWLFAGDGGFGSGVWTRDGRTWHVASSRRTPEGSERSSVNVITPVDENAFTLQATQRVVDGEEHPDSEKITVIRVKGE